MTTARQYNPVRATAAAGSIFDGRATQAGAEGTAWGAGQAEPD